MQSIGESIGHQYREQGTPAATRQLQLLSSQRRELCAEAGPRLPLSSRPCLSLHGLTRLRLATHDCALPHMTTPCLSLHGLTRLHLASRDFALPAIGQSPALAAVHQGPTIRAATHTSRWSVPLPLPRALARPAVQSAPPPLSSSAK